MFDMNDEYINPDFETYAVTSYYGADHNNYPYGVEDSIETSDFDEAVTFLWEKLNHGNIISIVNQDTGKDYMLSPDYLDDDNACELSWLHNVLD